MKATFDGNVELKCLQARQRGGSVHVDFLNGPRCLQAGQGAPVLGCGRFGPSPDLATETGVGRPDSKYKTSEYYVSVAGFMWVTRTCQAAV